MEVIVMEMGRGRQIIVGGAAVVGGFIGGLAAGEGLAWNEGRPMAGAEQDVADAEALHEAALVMEGVGPNERVGEERADEAELIAEEFESQNYADAYYGHREEGDGGYWVHPNVDADSEALSQPLPEVTEAGVENANEELSGIEGDVDSARTTGRTVGGAIGAVAGGGAALYLTKNRQGGVGQGPRRELGPVAGGNPGHGRSEVVRPQRRPRNEGAGAMRTHALPIAERHGDPADSIDAPESSRSQRQTMPNRKLDPRAVEIALDGVDADLS